MPAVSVVLPTHNRARLLARAMRSVLDQSFGDLELIVVDDASTDDTERVVQAMEDARIRYQRHDRNIGAPAARNAGIEMARAPLVAFQDSDDEWVATKLERQMAVLQTCGDADVVYCAFIRSGDRPEVRIPGPRQRVREGDILAQLLSGNFVSTQTLLTTRARLQEVGGFDGRLARFQDWDLAIRLASVTRFRLVDDPLVILHGTPGSISTNDAAGAEALRIMLRTHADQYERHPLSKASALAGLGHLECLVGDMGSGRGHMIESLAITPGSLGTVAALLLSLLGRSVYRFGSTTRRSFGSARTAAPAIAAAQRSN